MSFKIIFAQKNRNFSHRKEIDNISTSKKILNSNFFNLYDKKLIPSTVASGLRIELALAQWQKALLTTGATDASGYTIENIEFRNEPAAFARACCLSVIICF